MEELESELNFYRKKNREEGKLIEQKKQLESILDRMYSVEIDDSCDMPLIKIRHRGFHSRESGYSRLHCLFIDSRTLYNPKGAMVAELYPFKKIEIWNPVIYDFIKKFGEEWHYKQLIKMWR